MAELHDVLIASFIRQYCDSMSPGSKGLNHSIRSFATFRNLRTRSLNVTQLLQIHEDGTTKKLTTEDENEELWVFGCDC